MKCHTNVNFTPPTQLPYKFSYIVAIKEVKVRGGKASVKK
jgi:hypothetical protein